MTNFVRVKTKKMDYSVWATREALPDGRIRYRRCDNSGDTMYSGKLQEFVVEPSEVEFEFPTRFENHKLVVDR